MKGLGAVWEIGGFFWLFRLNVRLLKEGWGHGMQWTIGEAKNQLSKLIQATLAEDEVVIAKNGVPPVKLVKVEPAQPRRQPGPGPVWRRRRTIGTVLTPMRRSRTN